LNNFDSNLVWDCENSMSSSSCLSLRPEFELMGRSVLLSTSDGVGVTCWPGHKHNPSVVVVPTVVDVDDDPVVEVLEDGQTQAVVVVDWEAGVDVVDLSVELWTACLFPLTDRGPGIIWDLFSVDRSSLPLPCEISLEDISNDGTLLLEEAGLRNVRKRVIVKIWRKTYLEIEILLLKKSVEVAKVLWSVEKERLIGKAGRKELGEGEEEGKSFVLSLSHLFNVLFWVISLGRGMPSRTGAGGEPAPVQHC